MTGEKDFSDIDVERPEIMTPAEFIRKERSRYVEIFHVSAFSCSYISHTAGVYQQGIRGSRH